MKIISQDIKNKLRVIFKKIPIIVILGAFLASVGALTYSKYKEAENNAPTADLNNSPINEQNKTILLHKLKQRECLKEGSKIEEDYEKNHDDKGTIKRYERLLEKYKPYGGCEIKTKAKRYIYL